MVVSLPSAGERPAKDALKSRVTNGSKLLPNVDGRSAWVRRAKDLIEIHTADLGGPDNASAAEQSLVRRACVLTVELEQLEAKFAQAGQASTDDLDVYQRCASSLRRLLEAIGIQRRPRDITPTIDDIIHEHSHE